MDTGVFSSAQRILPFPIAAKIKTYATTTFNDDYLEWDSLSARILPATLCYLSHLLLSDLVALKQQPPQLYHRIESILSRPTTGQYLGFLRDTVIHYRQENIHSGIPELVDLIFRSDISNSVTSDGRPLLGTLVEYRNLLAHGRLTNKEVMRDILDKVRSLTGTMLGSLSFLEKYPLFLEDGTQLTGSEISGLDKRPQPMMVISSGDIKLRPLLLKLEGDNIALLDELDMRNKKLGYRGHLSYQQFRKKDLDSGDGEKVFNELKNLLEQVRSDQTLLDVPDWDTFRKRSAVISQRTISIFEESGKYKEEYFVPRTDWEGNESVFNRFMNSQKSLLAISGVQGTGKSALAVHLVKESIRQGHAVLFINAQRFTFTDLEWNENPFPGYFADQLRYSPKFTRESFQKVLKNRENKDGKVVLFIDAINEVDGLTNKWNKFVAMEKLLEWIGSIAMQDMKIVLTFRLDEYIDHEYLQDEDLPGNLYDICYEGNNSEKRWILDLEPFNEEQAEALYNRLQKHESLGMAPLMSWEEIKEGLGDKLESITDNPLIFTIFLRAHHKESMLKEVEREKIIEQYAYKLCGTLERMKLPWWRKAWEFVKNGNTTPKERFLADLVDKMSEGASSAFMVDDLKSNLKKGRQRKRDKRLIEVFQFSDGDIVKDLREGGMLIQEKIERRIGESEVETTRITFVGELVSKALTNFLIKINQLNYCRRLAWIIIIMIVVLSFGLVVTKAEIRNHNYFMRDFENYLVDASIFDIVYLMVCFIGLFNFVGYSQERSESIFLKYVGIFNYTYLHTEFKAAFKEKFTTPISVLSVLVISPLLYPLIITKDLVFSYFYFLPTLSLIVLLISFVVNQTFRLHLLSITFHITNIRSRTAFINSFRRNFTELGYKNEVIHHINKATLWTLLFLLILITYYLVYSSSIKPSVSEISTLLSMKEYFREEVFALSYIHLSESGFLADKLIYIIAPILTLILIGYPLTRSALTNSYAKLDQVRPISYKKKVFIACFLVLFLFGPFVFFLTLGDKLGQSDQDRDIELRRFETITILGNHGFSGGDYEMDYYGNPTQLSFQSKPDSSVRILLDKYAKNLIKLNLDTNSKIVIDLARFPELLYLGASGANIRNLSNSKLIGLNLYKPDGLELALGENKYLKKLSIFGRVSSWATFEHLFPDINQLSVGMNELFDIKTNRLPNWSKQNIIFEIKGHPIKDLTPEHACSLAKYIIYLNGLSSIETESMRLFDRIAVNLSQFDFEQLKGSRKLKWLIVNSVWREQDIMENKNSLINLREFLSSSLPSLESIELVFRLGEVRLVNVIRSFTNANDAVKFIDEIILKPTSLEVEDLSK